MLAAASSEHWLPQHLNLNFVLTGNYRLLRCVGRIFLFTTTKVVADVANFQLQTNFRLTKINKNIFFSEATSIWGLTMSVTKGICGRTLCMHNVQKSSTLTGTTYISRFSFQMWTTRSLNFFPPPLYFTSLLRVQCLIWYNVSIKLSYLLDNRQ